MWPARAACRNAPGELGEIFFVRTKAQVLQSFGFAVGVNAAPAMLMTVRVQIDAVSVPAHVEAKRAVKLFGGLEIGHAEDESIERMDAYGVVAASSHGRS